MSLPSLIRKRDGRLVPFEPERISRSLFTVTELMGTPNAFLARELTDGVVHFISLEADDSTPSTSDLAELVTKVVRELGYPAIARIYEESIRTAARRAESGPKPLFGDQVSPVSPPVSDPLTAVHRAAREQLREFSLSRVYPRDLVSAHRNGLLRLLDLDHPYEAAGMVLSPLPSERWDLLETIVAARSIAGSFLVLDSPELALAESSASREQAVESFLKSLDRSLQLTGLRAIINLNISDSVTESLANPGALFEHVAAGDDRGRADAIADLILERATDQVIFWHLSERDLLKNRSARLRESGKRWIAHPKIEFVFDRERQPVVLGPGLNRHKRTVLGFVGMNLCQLADQIGGDSTNHGDFFRKLGSLTRLAKSVGHARQDFLRKNGRPELQRGFQLERAVEIVIPEGVLEAAHRLARDSDSVHELALQCLETIREALASDGLRALNTQVDYFAWDQLNYSDGRLTDCKDLARQQLRLGSRLLKACGGGGLTIQYDAEQSLDIDEMVELLRTAYRSPDIDRICFVKSKPLSDGKK